MKIKWGFVLMPPNIGHTRQKNTLTENTLDQEF